MKDEIPPPVSPSPLSPPLPYGSAVGRAPLGGEGGVQGRLSSKGKPQGIAYIREEEQKWRTRHRSPWGSSPALQARVMMSPEAKGGSYGPEPAPGTFLIIRILGGKCLETVQRTN